MNLIIFLWFVGTFTTVGLSIALEDDAEFATPRWVTLALCLLLWPLILGYTLGVLARKIK